MQRYGNVVKVRPEKFEEYKRLHAAAWPRVLEMLTECNFRNFSIFHKNGYLFSYYEYVGEDIDADNARIIADPVCREWDRVCGLCMEPLETRGTNDPWLPMEELFHLD